jgi:hypothetical protein
MDKQVVVADPRPASQARLLPLLEQLNLSYQVVNWPAQVLEQVRRDSPKILLVAPEFANLSGVALLALARAINPRLEGLILEQPERDRGLLENLARRIRPQEGSR